MAALTLVASLVWASVAMADSASQCAASLGLDGKLHSGADAVQVADACLASAGNNPQASYLAGVVLENGIGKPKDAGKAEDWYRKAANKGQVQAQMAMGRIAEGKHKNDQALAWYSRAALKDYKPAQAALLRLRTDDPYAMWDAAEFAIAIDDSLGRDADFTKSGSGILIGDDLVVTNEHVVAGCKKMAVSPGLPARVLASDAARDLAVIKTAIPLGASVPVAAGSDIAPEMDLYTGGYPGLGDDDPTFVMTDGRLAERKLKGDDSLNYWLLTNQIHPGNSGGPLLDKSGLVVGVVAAELPVTGIVKKDAPKNARNGMAIRAETLRSFLDEHRVAYDRAERGPVTDAAAGMKRHAAAVTVLVECFGS